MRKVWTAERFRKDLREAHGAYLASDKKNTFLQFVKSYNSKLDSAVLRNGKTVNLLKDAQINPWGHLASDFPFGDSEVEEKEILLFFASYLAENFELSDLNIGSVSNGKLRRHRLPVPPRYQNLNYALCFQNNCKIKGITCYALYQRLTKKRGVDGWAKFLKLAGINYESEVRKQEKGKPKSTKEIKLLSGAERLFLTELSASLLPEVRAISNCLLDANKGTSADKLKVYFVNQETDNAAKQKVSRILDNFEQDRGKFLLELKSQSFGGTWNFSTILEAAKDLHGRWVNLAGHEKDKTPLDYKFVKNRASSLISFLENEKISMSDFWSMAGIDPFCHTGKFVYGETTDERFQTLKKFILKMIEDFGLNNMNYETLGKLHRKSIIELSNEGEYDRYPICKHADCKRHWPSVGAIMRMSEQFFGSWGKALQSVGINYEVEVQRKVYSHDNEYYIQELKEYIELHPNWTVAHFKDDRPSTYRGIFNRAEDGRLRFLHLTKKDVTYAAFFEVSWIQAGRPDSKIFFDENNKQLWSDFKTRRTFDGSHIERGRKFEKAFLDALLNGGLKKVASQPNEGEFVYNKSIKDCAHETKCRPDFVFSDFIIDTKTTFVEYSDAEQLERYSDHIEKCYCLTLRQNQDLRLKNSAVVQIISLNRMAEIPLMKNIKIHLPEGF